MTPYAHGYLAAFATRPFAQIPLRLTMEQQGVWLEGFLDADRVRKPSVTCFEPEIEALMREPRIKKGEAGCV